MTRVLHSIALVLHPQPPHAIGDTLSCPCGKCTELRCLRVQETCARLRATHWAYQQPANDQADIGGGAAVVLMRARLYPGVAPEAHDESGVRAVGGRCEPTMPLRDDDVEAKRPTSRPPGMCSRTVKLAGGVK